MKLSASSAAAYALIVAHVTRTDGLEIPDLSCV